MLENNKIRRRMGVIAMIMGVVVLLLVNRLFQLYVGWLGVDEGTLSVIANTQYERRSTIQPPRGEIYDRSGVLLATNTIEYEIGISPSLIYDGEQAALQLSEVTGLPYEDILADIQSDLPYVQLFRPAPASMGQAVLDLELPGVVVDPLQRRYYPHDTLAAHVLGFVGYNDVGYYGIEGYYNRDLRGTIDIANQSRIPFNATGGDGWSTGDTMYLTIDSEIQHLAESTLALAMQQTGAEGGTIIVMDPQTGAILAMANAPTFNPNNFVTEGEYFENPAVSWQFEPGSTLKAMTAAIALDEGVVGPNWAYEDTVSIEIGGANIYNWNRAAHGTTSLTQMLAKSLNVGAARLSLAIGPTTFYANMEEFGFGTPSGVDLQGEAAGTLIQTGDAGWTDAYLPRNAFGQGIATTPLQVVRAFGALANDGLLMQPYMVDRTVSADGTVSVAEPVVISRPISPDTAQTITNILSTALETEASAALVPGYRIAGKTGTAQIPVPGGYDPDRTITSFVGYGPIESPQFVVFVKLDKPTTAWETGEPSIWGSQTAAPAFGYLVERLVVLMEIPPDTVRANR